MKKKEHPKGKRPPDLDEADALFEHAMQDVGGEPDAADALFAEVMAEAETATTTDAQDQKSFNHGDDLFAKAMADDDRTPPHIHHTETAEETLPPGLTTAGLLKRCRQGQIAPELTLDLHRMLREEAKSYLRRRLQEAQINGNRIVIVITGRGLHSKGRAILRDEVPRWLKTDNADCVEGFEKAPRSMGGEGALLVILRRGASPFQN